MSLVYIYDFVCIFFCTVEQPLAPPTDLWDLRWEDYVFEVIKTGYLFFIPSVTIWNFLQARAQTLRGWGEWKASLAFQGAGIMRSGNTG